MKQSKIREKLQDLLRKQIEKRWSEAIEAIFNQLEIPEKNKEQRKKIAIVLQNFAKDIEDPEKVEILLQEAPDEIKYYLQHSSIEKIFKQVLISMAELKQRIKSLEGNCHAFSIIFGAKNFFGSNDLMLWKFMLAIVYRWDGTEKELEEKINWSFKGKPKVGDILEEILNEVIYDQVKNKSCFMEFNKKNMTQSNFLKSEEQAFEILKNNILYTIKRSRTFAGHFNIEQLRLLLTKKSLKKTICLIGGLTHEMYIFYDDSELKPWSLYDPSYEDENDEFEYIQRYKTQKELIDKVFKDEGKILTIRFILLGEKDSKETLNYPAIFDFPYYKILDLQTQPGDLLRNGSQIVARYAPNLFSKIVKHWINNTEYFVDEFIEFLKKEKNINLYIWKMIAKIPEDDDLIRQSLLDVFDKEWKSDLTNRWCHLFKKSSGKELFKILRFFCATQEGGKQCFSRIIEKDKDGVSGLDYLADHYPKQISAVLSILLNQDNCEKVLEELLKLKVKSSFKNFHIGCLRKLLKNSKLKEGVQEKLEKFCRDQEKKEKYDGKKFQFFNEGDNNDNFRWLVKAINKSKNQKKIQIYIKNV